MIEAKGTKSAKEDDPRARYILKSEDVRSKAPALVTAMLTGFALYLKSALSSSAADASRNEPPPEQEPPSPQHTSSTQGTSSFRLVEGGLEGRPRERTSSDRQDRHRFNDDPETIDWPPFMFQRVDLGTPVLQRIQTMRAFSLRASNDNGTYSASGNSSRPTVPRDDVDSDEIEAEDVEIDEDDATPPNRAPRVSGPVTLLDVSGCAAVLIGLSDFLREASDPDGDVLQVSNVLVSSGTIVKIATGWLFDWTELGAVTVNYTISDGEFSINQTAHFNVVKAPPLVGTAADDVLLGTDCGDTIEAMLGDDSIDARGGADTVHAGGGNDNIVAGAGDDVIFAGLGNDIVFGGAGNDQIYGGAGRDRIWGDEGNDIVLGEEDDDFISGGAGNDLLFGNDGDDLIAGDAGDDVLDGGAGRDALSGGEGNDTIMGQEGSDTLSGDSGNDVLAGGAGTDIATGGAGADMVIGDLDRSDDHYDGGEGVDELDYSTALLSIVVDLVESVASGDEIGSDTVAGFEVVRLGSGDDTVIGSDGGETILVGAGDDIVHDGDGDDIVFCGAGDDVVIAANDHANDRYDGQSGLDTVDYSQAAHGIYVDFSSGIATGLDIGRDVLDSIEHVVGSGQGDVFTVGLSATVLHGGAGDDIFQFTLPIGSSSSEMVHHILDFMVGDRIETSSYRIFEQIADDLESHFEAVYGDTGDDDGLPIRVRHEGTHELSQTLIEIDTDNNNSYEMTINLSGHHMLVVIDAAA